MGFAGLLDDPLGGFEDFPGRLGVALNLLDAGQRQRPLEEVIRVSLILLQVQPEPEVMCGSARPPRT
ncbi:MAG: hypothetical protein C4332_06580 [Meiothermus sp.]